MFECLENSNYLIKWYVKWPKMYTSEKKSGKKKFCCSSNQTDNPKTYYF